MTVILLSNPERKCDKCKKVEKGRKVGYDFYGDNCPFLCNFCYNEWRKIWTYTEDYRTTWQPTFEQWFGKAWNQQREKVEFT